MENQIRQINRKASEVELPSGFSLTNEGVLITPEGKHFRISLVSKGEKIDFTTLNKETRTALKELIEGTFNSLTEVLKSRNTLHLTERGIEVEDQTNAMQVDWKNKKISYDQAFRSLIKVSGKIISQVDLNAIKRSRQVTIPRSPNAINELQETERKAETLISAPSSQRGAVIQAEFKDKDQVYGREIAERQNTVEILYRGNEDRIRYLKQQIGTQKQNPSLLKKAQYELELAVRTKVSLEKAKKNNVTWCSTSSNRQVLSRHIKKDEQRGTGYAKKLRNAHNDILPLNVNLRTHKVCDGSGEQLSTVNRSGAISDFRNGKTNLKEILGLQNALDQIYQSKTRDQNQPLKEVLNSEQIKQIQIIFENDFDEDPFAALIKESEKAKRMGIETDVNKAFRFILEKLEQKRMERQFFMENMLLQDLVTHLQGKSKEGTLDTSQFSQGVTLSRVSLLNGTKTGTPKGHQDFFLSELNEMHDMDALYDIFDGKTLIFDGTGPFVDLEGKIHLPFITKEEKKEKKLTTILFNISATENTENGEPQASINTKGFKKLQSNRILDSTTITNLIPQLQNPRSNKFDLVEELITLMQMKDTAFISINCFGGKDRTGVICAQLTYHHLRDHLRSGKKEDRIISDMGDQLFDDAGVAKQIIKDNTGHAALKMITKERLKPVLRHNAPIGRKISGVFAHFKISTEGVKTFIKKASDEDKGEGALK